MEKRPHMEGLALKEKKKNKNKLKIKKIMVTGDRGYIGVVLVEKLLKADLEVVGWDAGFFGNSTVNHPSYKKITKDIRKIRSSDLKGIDAVIHLSALSNDPMGDIDPRVTDEINFKASVRLAKLAKKSGIKKFIFSSSCSIYGMAKNGTVDEKSKVNPLTAYAKSKIDTEKKLKRMASENFQVYILRNSTVYGFSGNFRNDLVLNNLTTTALVYGEIRIQSDGTPWRPLIDVRDLCDVFIEFIKNSYNFLNGKVINIGFNENNFMIRDLANVIKKELPECKVVFTGEHGSDSRSYRVRFDLFRKEFPHLIQKWPLSKSVGDMIRRLKKNGFSKKDFESGRYARLAVLKKLIEAGKLDKNLYLNK